MCFVIQDRTNIEFWETHLHNLHTKVSFPNKRLLRPLSNVTFILGLKNVNNTINCNIPHVWGIYDELKLQNSHKDVQQLIWNNFVAFLYPALKLNMWHVPNPRSMPCQTPTMGWLSGIPGIWWRGAAPCPKLEPRVVPAWFYWGSLGSQTQSCHLPDSAVATPGPGPRASLCHSAGEACGLPALRGI